MSEDVSATRRKEDEMSETGISLEDAIAYLERPVASGGQNSEDAWQTYDQTACKIADLLRHLTRERDEHCAALAQKDAAILTLKDFGYAPGNYTIRCIYCHDDNKPFRERPLGDKRAVCCEPCAQKRLDAALFAAPATALVWRHKRRGTTYTVEGEAIMQADQPVDDYEALVVYRCRETAQLWVRPASEFHDGRFEQTEDAAP